MSPEAAKYIILLVPFISDRCAKRKEKSGFDLFFLSLCEMSIPSLLNNCVRGGKRSFRFAEG